MILFKGMGDSVEETKVSFLGYSVVGSRQRSLSRKSCCGGKHPENAKVCWCAKTKFGSTERREMVEGRLMGAKPAFLLGRICSVCLNGRFAEAVWNRKVIAALYGSRQQ